MFIRRKRLLLLEQRLDRLEEASEVRTFKFGKLNLSDLAKIVERISDGKEAGVKSHSDT